MIHFTQENTIGIIEFDSPRGNMISIDDLQILDEIIDNSNLRGLVLTGKNRSFCTGLIVEKGMEADSFILLDKILIKLFDYGYPVVSYLSGHAIGAGLLLLCCSDYIISNKNCKSKFGMPEVKLGFGIDQIMLEILKNSFTNNFVNKMILSAEYFNVQQLTNTGIINYFEEKSGIQECIKFINGIFNINSYAFCKKILHRETSNNIKGYFDNHCYTSLLSLIKNNEN